MMYLYDGTFDGLLSAFAEAGDAGADAAEFSPSTMWQPSLLEPVFRVGTSHERAEAFLARLRAQVSPEAVRRLTHLWWSELPGLESVTYQYVCLAFRYGAAVDQYHTHAAVRETGKVFRKVAGEIHRLHGLLRFRQLSDGSLAAPVAPDYNVLLPVAWHFQRRLGGERWVIHDTRRHLGAFFDGTALALLDLEPESSGVASVALEMARLSPEEVEFQRLWRHYFKAIAIPNRLNPDLQRRCMPRRYWRYLVEVPQAGPA